MSRALHLLLPAGKTPPTPLPPILCLPRELLTKCLEYALYTYDMHRRKPVALRHGKNVPSLPREFNLLDAQHKVEDPYFPSGDRAALFVCREFRLVGLELYYKMTYFLFDRDLHLRAFNASPRPDLTDRLQYLVLDHTILLRIQPSIQKCAVRHRSGVTDLTALMKFLRLRAVHFRVSMDVDPALRAHSLQSHKLSTTCSARQPPSSPRCCVCQSTRPTCRGRRTALRTQARARRMRCSGSGIRSMLSVGRCASGVSSVAFWGREMRVAGSVCVERTKTRWRAGRLRWEGCEIAWACLAIVSNFSTSLWIDQLRL